MRRPRGSLMNAGGPQVARGTWFGNVCRISFSPAVNTVTKIVFGRNLIKYIILDIMYCGCYIGRSKLHSVRVSSVLSVCFQQLWLVRQAESVLSSFGLAFLSDCLSRNQDYRVTFSSSFFSSFSSATVYFRIRISKPRPCIIMRSRSDLLPSVFPF